MALQPLIPAEQNNEASWYTSGLAGIVSGGIKVVEGAFSLGAELVDLGLDTNTAAQVEMFFDKPILGIGPKIFREECKKLKYQKNEYA